MDIYSKLYLLIQAISASTAAHSLFFTNLFVARPFQLTFSSLTLISLPLKPQLRLGIRISRHKVVRLQRMCPVATGFSEAH